MQINNVPLIFTTTGLDKGLSLLPNIAGFAATLKRNLRIVHVLGKRYRTHAERQMAAAIEALPQSDGLSHELIRIEPKQHQETISEIAGSSGGILTVLPTRHNFVNRLLAMMSDYEKQMIEGPLPILALPRNGSLPTSIRRVLFPIDLSPRSNNALDQAAAFAHAMNAELHLLHVFGDDRLLPAEVDSSIRHAARSPRELYQLDKDHVQKLAERANNSGVKTTSITAEGRAHTGILNYCGTEQIDLVIMASHGPRSSEDIWYGTTTARVIKGAQIPVIALRA